MSRTSHLVSLSLPLIALLAAIARPSNAQLAGVDLSTFNGGFGGGLGAGLGGGLAANIPGVDALDSIGTGETISNVLSTMGVNQNVIDAIVNPISNSRDAANMVRDMLTSNAANRREAISSTMGQIATPGQAVSAFNDLMNNAFGDAASQLADRMFPRASSGGLFRAADSGNTTDGPSFRAPGGAVVGFGLPVDPAAFGGFTAGVGLPPIGAATPADFAAFGTQLYGDITKQYNAVAKYQQEAQKKQKSEKKLNEACVQYALSEFLRAFASTLLTVGMPAGAIFSVLGEFAGLGYAGLTASGAAYLDTYCCDMVRASGISVGLGPEGTLNVGPIAVDLGALLGAIPGAAGGGAAGAATTAATAALGALTGGAIPGAAAAAGGGAGATVGLPTCTVFDWLAFALQGDEKLAKKFTDLLINAMKLEVRLFSDALTGASRAASAAARIVGRVAGGAGTAAAAAGDLALGGLLDVVAGP